MELAFDGAAARGLRRYADLVAEELGLVGTCSDMDLDVPVTVYLPVDRRLPEHPDRDAALVWHEEWGWSVAIDTARGEQTVALLGQILLPAPRVVARLATLLFDGNPWIPAAPPRCASTPTPMNCPITWPDTPLLYCPPQRWRADQRTGPGAARCASVASYPFSGGTVVDHLRQSGSADTEQRIARQIDEVTGALETLAQDLDQREELAVVLQRLCRQALAAIPDAAMASMTMHIGADAPRTVTATHEQAHDLDGEQYRSGRGPCLEAVEQGRVVRAVLRDRTSDWPEFVRAGSSAGVNSVLSAPLFLDRDCHGSLNLFGEAAHGYRELDAALLELYTTAAEAALQAEQRGARSRATVDQLSTALTSRAVIDQAKGILMAVRRIDADQAFQALVALSQGQNRKLRDVAEQFVARVVGSTGDSASPAG